MIEVPISYVQPGDTVGKSQTFKKFAGGMRSSVDLMKGYRLSARVISKLKNEFGVQYLCIHDPDAPEIELEKGLDETARQKIVSGFSDSLSAIQSTGVIDLKQLETTVEDIIDNVSNAIRSGMGSFHSLSKVFYEALSHDTYTWEHSVNTAIYAAIIGLSDPAILHEKQRLQVPGTFSKAEILTFNLLLHDIGKIRIPIEILNKKGSLSADERLIIEKHPYSGFVHLRKINEQIERQNMLPIPAYFMRGCLLHHQAYDGTGYPALRTKDDELKPLSGENIPIVGRIAAVADVFDALTSRRPYRLPFHAADALKILIRERGKKLDPKIVDVFVKKMVPYPKGTTVVLSTGELAVVVGHADGNGFHPTVRPYMKRIRKDGEDRVLRLPWRDPISITPGSEVKIVLNKDLYKTL